MCQVFLDLTRVHDTLDREHALSIFEAHRVGPNMLHLMCNFWDKLTLCLKQGGYYGRTLIDSQRGVTQGGILAPTLFNIIVDCIVQEHEVHCLTTSHSFYANDGCLVA